MNCWNCGASAKERMVFEMPLNVMKDCACNWPMNEWTSESMIQWINESMNEWTKEPMNQFNEPVNRWIIESMESMNQWTSDSVNQ